MSSQHFVRTPPSRPGSRGIGRSDRRDDTERQSIDRAVANVRDAGERRQRHLPVLGLQDQISYRF